MKKIQLPIIFCFIIILLSVLSCRKTDFASQDSGKSDALIEAQFFNAYRTDNPNEKKLVDYFKRLNDKTHFVVPTVKKIGYPRWNKILATELNNTASSFQSNSTSDSLNVSYIPFVIENDSVVNSSMVIKTTPSDTTFNILNNWQYADSATTNMSPKRFMIFMMALDKNVFGDRLYKITDTTAFGKSIQNRNTKYVTINDVSIGTTSNANLVSPLTLEICYITYEVGGQIDGCDPGADHCLSFIATEHCTDYDVSGIGGGGGGNGSTGGPGPGTGSTGNTGNGNTGGGNTPGGGTCVNCGGWTPTVYHPAILYVTTTISNDDPDWFAQSASHTQLAINVQNYLIQNSNSAQAISLSQAHCNKMMTDPAYLAFVNNHTNENIQNVYYNYDTEVEENLINPCLKSIINTITKEKHQSILFSMYNKSQQISGFKVKFKYEEVTSLPGNATGKTTATYTIDNITGAIKGSTVTIKLNSSQLNGKSKEYITSVVLHEICHGLILIGMEIGTLPATTDHHKEMVNAFYIKAIYESLIELYPTAIDSHMKDLAIGGLPDVVTLPDITSKIETIFPGINIYNAYNVTIPSYFNPLTGNGTPCN
jgi:hypothetical protein